MRATKHRKRLDRPTADSNIVGKQSKKTKFVVINIPDVKMAERTVPMMRVMKLLVKEMKTIVMTSPIQQSM